MALVSGFAMTVAASQWWSTSIESVLWVLPLWAVLYCLIERLVLKSFGTSWAWNLVITIPRLVLSLAIALVVGLPMSQVIYSGSINDQLSKTTTARIHQATNEITHLYDAKIAAAQKEIASVQSKEASLQKQVTNSSFLSECEAGEPSCSQTHKTGCGPYCKRDAREAVAAAAALKSARPEIRRDGRRRPAEDRALAVRRDRAGREQGLDDQGRPRLPRAPGRARSGRARESGREEVRRVLPRLPDRDRPRRARARSSRICSAPAARTSEAPQACARWTSSKRTACRSVRPSSRTGSRSRRGPRRTRTSCGSAARYRAGRRPASAAPARRLRRSRSAVAPR